MSYLPCIGDRIQFFNPAWANEAFYTVDAYDQETDTVTFSTSLPGGGRYVISTDRMMFYSFSPRVIDEVAEHG